jgi:hypothetical protein
MTLAEDLAALSTPALERLWDECEEFRISGVLADDAELRRVVREAWAPAIAEGYGVTAAVLVDGVHQVTYEMAKRARANLAGAGSLNQWIEKRSTAHREARLEDRAAEADSPEFKVGDGVRTHNGFDGVVSGVITRRTSGPTVEIHAEAADGRLGPSLGLWYRHQLTLIAEEA